LAKTKLAVHGVEKTCSHGNR